MTYPVRTWRPALRVLALALAIAAVPLPGMAGEPSQSSSSRPGIRASAATVVATTTLARSAQAQSAQDTKANLESGSFFKSPVGIAVLAVVAAGAGYAIYSTSHDRIKSPGKQ